MLNKSFYDSRFEKAAVHIMSKYNSGDFPPKLQMHLQRIFLYAFIITARRRYDGFADAVIRAPGARSLRSSGGFSPKGGALLYAVKYNALYFLWKIIKRARSIRLRRKYRFMLLTLVRDVLLMWCVGLEAMLL